MSNHPPIFQQVTWIYTKDLDGTAAFYTDVLGLQQVFDQGLCRIMRMADNSFLGVCFARPGRHVEPNGVVITMVSEEKSGVDAWYDKFQTSGASTEGAPEAKEDFNVYCFFAKDPNGYLIEFQCFLDPAWAAATKQ
jgi:catechol 2,3-dioxygenase-like lactoylglutathione lyase family enzyme